MTDKHELLEAYRAIFLQSLKGQITREERDARVVALRTHPSAAGLTFEERNKLANDAVEWAGEVIDEAYFSPSRGTWQ